MTKKNLFNKLVNFTASVYRETHELTKNATPASITQVQFKILQYIYVNKSVTPSEISDCENISMPNTSRELRKLSEKGLIEKINDTLDRRKHYVRLTSSGEMMMNEAFTLIESRFLGRIQHASKEDLIEIEDAIDILQSKLFYR